MTTPMNRRAAAAALFAASTAVVVPLAVAVTPPSGADAEILALSADIVRRAAETQAMREKRIDPYAERYCEIMGDFSKSPDMRWQEACAFSRECGREDSIIELNGRLAATDDLFKQLMAIPATTQAGRAAKVRALLRHVMRDEFLGPAEDLDWDYEMVRALLGEFAGMSADELASV